MPRKWTPEQVAYAQKLADIATEAGLDPAEFIRVAVHESGLNPKAKNKSGSAGIFQMMPSVAKAAGVDPMDPEASARWAAGEMAKSGKSGYDYYLQHNQGAAGAAVIKAWAQGREATFKGKPISDKLRRTVVRNMLAQPVMRNYAYTGDNEALARAFISAQGERYRSQGVPELAGNPPSLPVAPQQPVSAPAPQIDLKAPSSPQEASLGRMRTEREREIEEAIVGASRAITARMAEGGEQHEPFGPQDAMPVQDVVGGLVNIWRRFR